jgi:hypothetical protein
MCDGMTRVSHNLFWYVFRLKVLRLIVCNRFNNKEKKWKGDLKEDEGTIKSRATSRKLKMQDAQSKQQGRHLE